MRYDLNYCLQLIFNIVFFNIKTLIVKFHLNNLIKIIKIKLRVNYFNKEKNYILIILNKNYF